MAIVFLSLPEYPGLSGAIVELPAFGATTQTPATADATARPAAQAPAPAAPSAPAPAPAPATAAERFRALSADDRQALLAFLSAL